MFSSLCRGQDYYVPPVNHHPGQGNGHRDTLKKTSYFFSFRMGVSVPKRDYASKSANPAGNFMVIGPDSTNGKGFARAGFHGNISGGIFITHNFGFCVKIVYNENSFDELSLNAGVNGQYTYSIDNDYTIWQFMGGGFYNLQIGRTTSVWLQAMAGLIDANFPSFSIYNIPNYPYLSWNFTLPNANDLAWSLSLAFEKGITRNTSLLATASYTGSELVYPTLSYNFTGPYYNLPLPYTQHTAVTMSFGSLDFSVGFLFHL